MRARLAIDDVTALYRLADECGELWDQPAAWQAHVAAAIETSVGGVGAVILISDRGGVGDTIDTGRGASFMQFPGTSELLQRYVDQRRERSVPGHDLIQAELRKRGCFTSTFIDLLGATTYRDSAFYSEYMRPFDFDDLLCAVALNRQQISTSLSIVRMRGEPQFRARDRAFLSALAEVLGARVETKLATSRQLGRDKLSPRARQVLAALLAGDSEKQVAARLGMSTTTAHEHVTALYRHFGVQSRAELMSYFVRRRPRPPPQPRRLHPRRREAPTVDRLP